MITKLQLVWRSLLLIKIRYWQIKLLLLMIVILVTWAQINNQHDTVTINNNLITAPFIELANKQVPLPSRNWVMAGDMKETQALPNGTNVIASEMLFGIDRETVTSFVLIHTNTIPSPKGWGISRDCKNSKHAFTAIFEHNDLNYKCTFVGTMNTESQATVWTQANVLAMQKQWRLPKQWLVVGVRIADRLDVLDVRYGFDPQILINLSTNLTAQLGKDLYTESMQKLIKWQEVANYWVERGFHRQLERESALILPAPMVDQSATSLIAQSRFRQLDQLYHDGWLSKNELSLQQNLIQKSVITQTDLTVDIWSLGALKTAGHTTQSLFWMWGVNYLFLGNAYIAGGLALAKSAISPIRYYIEETAWNTWGPRRNPTLPIIDFR